MHQLAILDTENQTTEEQKIDRELKFVARTPGLKHVHRHRHAGDGYFPRFKFASEIMSEEDLVGVPDDMLSDIMRALIEREKQLDSKLSLALIRRLCDRDGPHVEQLYELMLHSRTYSDKKGSPSSSSSGASQWMTCNA